MSPGLLSNSSIMGISQLPTSRLISIVSHFRTSSSDSRPKVVLTRYLGEEVHELLKLLERADLEVSISSTVPELN